MKVHTQKRKKSFGRWRHPQLVNINNNRCGYIHNQGMRKGKFDSRTFFRAISYK
jgi:hypothetical protein